MQHKDSILWMFIIFTMAAIFIVDIQFPDHVTIGMPYIVVVLIGMWTNSIRHVTMIATVCSMAVILGFHLSPGMEHPVHGLVNGLMTLFAIWITATVAIYRLRLWNVINSERQKYHATLQASPDPILTIDENGLIQSANDGINKVFDWNPQELINQPFDTLLAEPYAAEFRRYVNANQSFDHNKFLGTRQEIQAKKRQGISFPCHLSLTKVKLPAGVKPLYMCITHDITDQKKTQDKLAWLVTHDEMTQVYNRRYFNENIDKEWRRLARADLPLGLIMLDMDYFKEYNDVHGEKKGDECLRRIAIHFNQQFNRPGDFIARYHGEQFVILLPNTNYQGIQLICNRLQDALAELAIPHPVNHGTKFITASLGAVCMIPKQTCNSEVIVKMADSALNQAKNDGKNTIVIYDNNNS